MNTANLTFQNGYASGCIREAIAMLRQGRTHDALSLLMIAEFVLSSDRPANAALDSLKDAVREALK